MATKLIKDITRESSDKFNEREIMVTLKDTQRVSLKLKGMKSGEVSINILELYKQLANVESPEEPETKKSKGLLSISNAPKNVKASTLINAKEFLSELRSSNAISMLDVETMCKFDGLISEAMDKLKEQK